jgi:hypothetical protein
MANVSVTNGLRTTTVAELSDEQIRTVLTHIERVVGDDELREAVHGDLAPCSEREFVEEFCTRFEAKHGAVVTIG